MFTIAKQFHFSGAHHLLGLRPDHPCGRKHGHNWIVEIILESQLLDEHGFVLDYGDLEPAKALIDTHFEHRDVNDTIPQPTAENMARWLGEHLPKDWPLKAVRVSETPKTWAEWRA